MAAANTAFEEDLILRCKKREGKAQELLYKHFYSYGMSIVLRYAYSRDEAAEILNDGFLKIFQNIDAYEINRSFKSWLRKIMVNTAIDFYRVNKKHYNKSDLEIVDNVHYSEEILDRLNADDILKLLEKLSKPHRMVFNLYEIEGYNHEEIGEKLNLAAGTSRSLLTRAKKQLRKLYIEEFECNHVRKAGSTYFAKNS